MKNKAGNIGRPVGELLPLVDELWRKGVQEITGLPVANELLQNINFPGRMVLLAIGTSPGGWLSNDTVAALVEAITRQVYEKSGIKEAGISADKLKEIVEGILNAGKTPRDWFLGWEIRGELAKRISEEAKQNGLPDLVSGGTLTDLLA